MTEQHTAVDMAPIGTSDILAVAVVKDGMVEQVIQHQRRPYHLHKPRMFLYEGRAGETYILPECNKALKIDKISECSISVSFPATGDNYGIAPNTEVIHFDPRKHSELIKRIPRVKPEKKKEGEEE
jgi:hypothetical protein